MQQTVRDVPKAESPMLSKIHKCIDGFTPQGRFAPYRGFTLIELVIVVALISLISGMGFISLRDYATKQYVTGTTNDLIAALRMARSRAQTQVKNTSDPVCQTAPLEGYSFAFDCQEGSCTGYSIAPVCGGVRGRAIDEVPFSPEVRVTTSTSEYFFTTVTGIVEGVDDYGHITITGDNDEAASISVHKDGRITSEE